MSSSLRSFSTMAKHTAVHDNDEWNSKYRSYLLLASEQEQIRQRLSGATPTHSPTSSFSSQGGATSLSSSPSETTVIPPRSLNNTFYHPSSPVSTELFPAFTAPSARSDEDRLLDVNRQIKATLTDLLNHPGVRHDASFSSWVKERLMDTAHERRELRKMRCERRSMPSLVSMSSSSDDEMDTLRF